MVIAACLAGGFSCRVMLLSLSSHWTVTVLSLEIFANMDQKIQAAVAQACKAVAVAVEPSRRSYSDQSKTVNIARTEREGRRHSSILAGFLLALFFEQMAVLRFA